MRVERHWIAALAIILMVIGLLFASDGREQTDSTFGVGRTGYKALHDLLVELGMPVRRSYLGPGELPPQTTVWWLGASQSPFDLNSSPCGSVGDKADSAEVWSGQAWLEVGGTAVVFVTSGTSEQSCKGVAGFDLPSRLSVDTAGSVVAPAPSRRTLEEPDRFVIRGFERERKIQAYSAAVFENTGDWSAVAWIGEHPLILERAVDRGRLVAVADSRLLQNRWLADDDAAPFAVDLVRRYGTPLLDENAHGFRPSQEIVAYLAASPARSVFAGLLLLGLLVFWRGSLVPGMPLEDSKLPAPTLESYVDALAGWYARGSDHGPVAERYRQYALTRLRRHLGLSSEIPAESVIERLGGAQAKHQPLLRIPAVRNRDELFAVVGAIDAVVRTAMQPRAGGGTLASKER